MRCDSLWRLASSLSLYHMKGVWLAGCRVHNPCAVWSTSLSHLSVLFATRINVEESLLAPRRAFGGDSTQYIPRSKCTNASQYPGHYYRNWPTHWDRNSVQGRGSGWLPFTRSRIVQLHVGNHVTTHYNYNLTIGIYKSSKFWIPRYTKFFFWHFNREMLVRSVAYGSDKPKVTYIQDRIPQLPTDSCNLTASWTRRWPQRLTYPP